MLHFIHPQCSMVKKKSKISLDIGVIKTESGSLIPLPINCCTFCIIPSLDIFPYYPPMLDPCLESKSAYSVTV